MKIYAPGARIAGRYEVAGRPLMGGMGIVYVCLDHEENRPVALKTFKPEYLPDRAARDRFLREGTAWVDLGAHPHVVRCHQVIHTDPEVYLVLELVAREQGREDASLRSWLTPGVPLPVEQALLFALQIARGMVHATATIPGFVHRDLKPENVLVGADRLSQARVNRLRVTDFGLVKIVAESGVMPLIADVDKADPRQLQFTRGAGTPLYMAPEQWKGERVTVETDAYALGCILYEMLTGYRAVEGNSLTALERAHCERKVRPLPGGLPEAVRGMVARCLAVEPGERYGTWEEVEEALAGAYVGVTGRAAPGPEPVQSLDRAERMAAGWSYSAVGASYLDIGKAEVALNYFKRAREVGEAEGERRLEAAGLNHLGVAYANLGDARRAIGFYEQALAIDREIGDRRGESAALGNLGLAYAHLSEARRAIGYFEQQLVITREIGDRRGEGNALNNLGEAYRNLGDARRAIGFYEQALAIQHETGNRRGEGITLGNRGSAYLQLGEVRWAIGCYEQCLTIHREIGDRRGEGNALGNLGIAYKNLGDARRAIGFYEQALAIDREIGDRLREGDALGNLGSAYLQLGDAQRAIRFYEQTLAIDREIGNRHGEGITLGNLGSAYLQLGDARRAIEYCEHQLVITREIGDRRGEGNALGNLGIAYKNLGDTRRAIGCYEQCLTIHREIGDAMGVATVSFNMARLYAQQGESARALEPAQEAARIFAQIGHAGYAQRAQQLVAQLQGGAAPSGGPYPTEVLQQFAPVIEAVVAAARGHRQARAAVEAAFGLFEQGGWRIVEPIQRIWAGERGETALTAGIDPNSALIVREILKQLGTERA